MALKKSGVQLVAEGDAAFMAVMMQAGKAVVSFGDATQAAGGSAAATAQRIARLTDTIGLQNRQLAIAERQLKETVAAHGADSIAAQKQALAVDRLSASIRNNEATLNRLQTELTQTDRAFDKAASGSSKLGEVMTGALRRAGEMAINLFVDIGRAALQGIGAAVSMAGDYEQSMNVLQAQSGATAEQMARISARAQELGADLTLPATSAVDAGQAMLELSKGGLEVEQSMDAAKGTLQLAAAAETDVATAANTMTGALSAFGLEGDKAVYVADLLTNAANKSRASINDVGLGFQQAAFRFESAGQGADDLAASLTVLINAGLGGSDAGTALQNAIARLQGPTDKAAKLMASLGINVYDAQGNMLPMQQIIGVLNKAFQGMTQAERNAALQTIFLSDGMKAMIPLLNKGADGFADVKTEMNESGAAAKMAEAQTKGLKGAWAGLQSQAETLALEALQPLLPILTGVLSRTAEWAGSLVGTVGPAIKGTIDVITLIADVITTGAVPALYALTGATVLYALTNLPAMIAALGTATAALGVHAAAILAAAGPFAIIAGAIAAVLIKYKELDNQLKAVADKVLEGNAAYQESVRVLDIYDKASDTAKEGAKDQAEALRQLQEEQRGALEQYTLHRAAYEQFGIASGQTADSLQRERDAINARTTAIQEASGFLERQITLYGEVDGRRESIEQMSEAHETLSESVEANVVDYEALEKEIEKVTENGAKAIQGYVNAAMEFQAKLTKAVTEGNREQAREVAANYAEQLASAKASIGEQLIAFTMAQSEMSGANEETTAAIVRQIEKEFGIVGSVSYDTFLAMEGDIRSAMENGGTAVDGLGEKLRGRTDDAITMKEKMDALAHQYEMELLENFDPTTDKIEDLRAELEKIPAKVYSEVHVHTEYTSSGSNRQETGTSGLARGGPMRKGETRLVGERGPEMFTAGASGFITPNHRMPPASPAQIMMPRPQVIIMQPASTSNTTNYNTTNNNQLGAPLSFDHLAAMFGSRG